MYFFTLLVLLTLIFLPVLYYVLPWFNNKRIRDIPGPTIAAFSNLWLLYQCRKGKRFIAVDEAHKKYGTLVRIQPNHVSVADDQAINLIYGHGNGFLKRYVDFCETDYVAWWTLRKLLVLKRPLGIAQWDIAGNC